MVIITDFLRGEIIMEDIDKEVLSHIPPKTKTLIEKLFKTSVEDFYEKLLNLETDELILSIPINIRRDQYLIIVTKEKKDCCIAKFCKGPSFINEVLKERREFFHTYNFNAAVLTFAFDTFFNKCMSMKGIYDVEYKAFKEFVKTDFLFAMIRDYTLDENKKEEAKSLTSYIKLQLRTLMKDIRYRR